MGWGPKITFRSYARPETSASFLSCLSPCLVAIGEISANYLTLNIEGGESVYLIWSQHPSNKPPVCLIWFKVYVCHVWADSPNKCNATDAGGSLLRWKWGAHLASYQLLNPFGTQVGRRGPMTRSTFFSRGNIGLSASMLNLWSHKATMWSINRPSLDGIILMVNFMRQLG